MSYGNGIEKVVEGVNEQRKTVFKSTQCLQILIKRKTKVPDADKRNGDSLYKYQTMMVGYQTATAGLVRQFRFQELAVQASDVGNAFVLGANGFASTSVGAVTEAEFVHLSHHGLGTLGCFGAALR